MQKRIFLAFVLSMLVVSLWMSFISKQYPVENKEVSNNLVPQVLSSQSSVLPSKVIPPSAEIVPIKLVEFTNKLMTVIFDENTASIQEAYFNNNKHWKMLLHKGYFLNNSSKFKVTEKTDTLIVFVGQVGNLSVEKRFYFSNTNYSIVLEFIVQNKTLTEQSVKLDFALGEIDFTGNPQDSQYKDIAVSVEDKTKHYNGRKSLNISAADFVAIRDRYFTCLISHKSLKINTLIEKVDNQRSKVDCQFGHLVVAPNQTKEEVFRGYIGPQDVKLINNVNPQWSFLVNFGTFDIISQTLLKSLEIINRFVHNWGFSIILLSIFVYLLLYPLTLKQLKSMKEMQLLQPKIAELEKLYKSNPEKLNKERLKLFQEHKVNPLGGCLPLLLQMPIFIGLYQGLIRSFSLKGASFLWVKDLSEPDKIVVLANNLPIIGNEINLLPIIMTAVTFVQQKTSMGASGSANSEQQKMMLFLMPIIFMFIFYHMPAGLVLYWLVNSSLSAAFQLKIYGKKS